MSASVGSWDALGAPESDDTNARITVELVRRTTPVSSLDNLDLLPSLITADAVDLLDCEVASTCGSDTDPVVLFDVQKESESWVIENKVLIRNLHPDVCADLIERTIKSRIGMRVSSLQCPSFWVSQCGRQPHHTNSSEFNFGFAVISLANVDEAINLNYILHSHGGVDQFFLSKEFEDDSCISPVSTTCDDADQDGRFLNDLSNTIQ